MSILKKIKKGDKCIITFLGKNIFTYKRNSKKFTFIQKFASKGKTVDIQPNCRIFHPENIHVGNNVRIGYGALIEALGELYIGDNVIFGPDVTIWTANHNYENPDKLPYDGKINLCPVTIKNNVWLGGKCIILPGVTIEEGAVVAMGAVVTKDVPPGAVVGGNPAKVLKYRNMEKYYELRKNNSFYNFS